MNIEDVVIGRRYKFIDPNYPEWVGQVIVAKRIVANMVHGAVVKAEASARINGMYPVGRSLVHSAYKIEPETLSVVESMFE